MKAILIIGTSLLIILSVLQMVLNTYINNRTEQMKYKVILEEDGFQLRYYFPAIMAEYATAGSLDRNSNFRELASYIFGSNEDEKKIAMTAPVIMREENDSLNMKFVMPSEYKFEDLPEPNNDMIRLKKADERYAAVVSFGGFSNQKKIKASLNSLKKYLDLKGIDYSDEFEFYAYNPPFQLAGRHNEVVIPLNKEDIRKAGILSFERE